ncbi:MAG: ABC transporter permease, partial [Pseudomonadota bacterium]
MDVMPKWADALLIPLISILIAFFISGLVILAIGEDPINALNLMIEGTFGRSEGIGYMLYYATNFTFTGLAVAVAFHARLFNIGGEGQAILGGLGVALVCLAIDWPHWMVALPAAIIGGALFGALWAAVPAFLQARRGSHIVITTIMFNFIAAALLTYMLVEVLKPAGSMDPASSLFPEGTHLPTFRDMFAPEGSRLFGSSPVNVTFFVALAACYVVWLLIWRTRLGYEIRAFGHSEPAAEYAGISPTKIIMVA